MASESKDTEGHMYSVLFMCVCVVCFVDFRGRLTWSGRGDPKS